MKGNDNFVRFFAHQDKKGTVKCRENTLTLIVVMNYELGEFLEIK